MSLMTSSATGLHSRQREEAGEAGVDLAARGRTGYFRWKIAADFAIAALLLAPTTAMIAILVLLVRATSKGPGIYRQMRVGKHGRRFMIYKIRTMRVDAEAASGPVWTQPRDPRVTFLGRILRKLHLDELPQIFNVLRGEMSFVGPRPERPEFTRVLSEAIPHYRDRLAVRPGITGLAQVNLPPDTDLQSVRRKLFLDCQYVRNAGPWLDFRLFVCSLARMFRVSLVHVLGLRRTVVLPDFADPATDAPALGGGAAIHVPHANGKEDGHSKSHVGHGATSALRQNQAPNRPR
jgi:lipopolysaccharide/colanic/teichoic acid biosynthesis glycosyltransferase